VFNRRGYLPNKEDWRAIFVGYRVENTIIGENVCTGFISRVTGAGGVRYFCGILPMAVLMSMVPSNVDADLDTRMQGRQLEAASHRSRSAGN